MSESADADELEAQSYLVDEPYGDLMNLARSMNEQFEDVDINTSSPGKTPLIEALEPYEVDGDRDSGWSVEVDGERHDVELLDVQTRDTSGNGSSGPSDKTIFYCFTRKETTPERVEVIRNALDEHTDFEMRETTGDRYTIVLPAENQDNGFVELDESDFESEEEDADGDAESAGESEDDDSETETSDESEESSESESEATEDDADDESESDAEDADEEDDDDSISRDAYVEHLNDNKTKDQVYDLAVEYDVDGRTNMNKGELVEAVADANPEVGA